MSADTSTPCVCCKVISQVSSRSAKAFKREVTDGSPRSAMARRAQRALEHIANLAVADHE